MSVDARLLSGRTIYGVSGDVIVWISLGLAGLVLIQSRRRR
jgi:hypothetical protein